MVKVERKLAEEFAQELIAELKKENKLEISLLNWGLLQTTLILKIQEMSLLDAVDKVKLTGVVHESLNHILGVNRGECLDEQLICLLNKDLIQLVITQHGKLAYQWKS
jgi:hypothetical protein